MISRARGSDTNSGRKKSEKSTGRKKSRKGRKASSEPVAESTETAEAADPTASEEDAEIARDEAAIEAASAPSEGDDSPREKKATGKKKRGRKKPGKGSKSRIADLVDAEAPPTPDEAGAEDTIEKVPETDEAGATEATAVAASPETESPDGEPSEAATGEAGKEDATGEDPSAPSPELTASDESELPQLDGDRLRACIESILFASPEPVTRRRLYRLLPEADKAQIRDALLELEGELLTTARGYFLVEDASGFRFLSKAEFAPFVARLRGEKRKVRLSAAAFETLAVIAYRQPARRADLEAIRGVQCGAIIKNLMEWDLLRVVGHDDSPGRPLLYGTTGEFLEMLGLSSLGELPEPERLRERGEDRGLQVLDRIIEEGGRPKVEEGSEEAMGEDPPEGEIAAPEIAGEAPGSPVDSADPDPAPAEDPTGDISSEEGAETDQEGSEAPAEGEEFDLDLEEEEE